MAQPEKVTFYSSAPNMALSLIDPLTGETTTLRFKDGKFETSDPAFVEKLNRLADTPEVAISRKAPSSPEKAK